MHYKDTVFVFLLVGALFHVRIITTISVLFFRNSLCFTQEVHFATSDTLTLSDVLKSSQTKFQSLHYEMDNYLADIHKSLTNSQNNLSKYILQYIFDGVHSTEGDLNRAQQAIGTTANKTCNQDIIQTLTKNVIDEANGISSCSYEIDMKIQEIENDFYNMLQSAQISSVDLLNSVLAVFSTLDLSLDPSEMLVYFDRYYDNAKWLYNTKTVPMLNDKLFVFEDKSIMKTIDQCIQFVQQSIQLKITYAISLAIKNC